MIAAPHILTPAHLPAAIEASRALVVLYVGPDQMLPLTSALGAIVGVLMMFWHRFVGLVRRAWRFTLTKLGRAPAEP